MRFTIKNLHWLDLGILFWALIVTLLGIGSYGLYEPHEGHFAMVGQEMVWRNDWITPHLNGSPYLNKPPLMYWSIAAATKFFSSTEFAVRFPLGFMGWVGIAIAWKWTRELWGIGASRFTALMLSVTLGWFIFTHQILIDVFLGTLLLSSNYFLWRLLYQPRSWLNWAGTYISLAGCLLTKGLIGVVFPLVGCFALIVIRKDWKIVQRIKLFPGLLLVCALVLPWFLAVERANPGFLHYFIFNEHLDRIFDRRFPPDYEVSKVSALEYLAITACWCFPWILFLPSVIKSTWQEWQRGFCANASIGDRKNSDGIFLLVMAAILPVVLFLPLSSRLIYYSIPAIPAYIILCAGWWDKCTRKKPAAIKQSTTLVEYPLENKKVDYTNNATQSPVAMLCKSSICFLDINPQAKKINLYGAIAIILGVCFYGVIAFVPAGVNLLPIEIHTREIINLTILVAIALGTGWLIAGVGIVKGYRYALIPLVIGLAITYLATIRGFYLYQDLRSSKNLVRQANACLGVDTLWTFEGSREIGAAGAISYYLNQDKIPNPPQKATPGWTTTPRPYRMVMILSDGGKNRLPPQFPGSPPDYLITQAELQQYWNSDRPTVFMTDFLRSPNNSQDPITLNLPQGAIEPYLVSGQRRLYLNEAATKLANRQCN